MDANFTLDSDKIETLAAADISANLCKSRQFWDELKKDIGADYRNETLAESSEARSELRTLRTEAVAEATKRINTATTDAISQATKDAEKAAKDKLTREIGSRWGSLSTIANEQWIKTEMRELIREQVRQAFGRTAAQLARASMKSAKLEELLDGCDDEYALRGRLNEACGTGAAAAANAILGNPGNMQRLEMLLEEDLDSQAIRQALSGGAK